MGFCGENIFWGHGNGKDGPAGPKMDPKWDPELTRNGTRNVPEMGPEMDPKWDPECDQIGSHFGITLGSLLGPLWDPFRTTWACLLCSCNVLACSGFWGTTFGRLRDHFGVPEHGVACSGHVPEHGAACSGHVLEPCSRLDGSRTWDGMLWNRGRHVLGMSQSHVPGLKTLNPCSQNIMAWATWGGLTALWLGSEPANKHPK